MTFGVSERLFSEGPLTSWRGYYLRLLYSSGYYGIVWATIRGQRLIAYYCFEWFSCGWCNNSSLFRDSGLTPKAIQKIEADKRYDSTCNLTVLVCWMWYKKIPKMRPATSVPPWNELCIQAVHFDIPKGVHCNSPYYYATLTEINRAQHHLPLDLRKAVELAKSVTHWFLLGVRLGVPYSELKVIEQQNPRDVQRCKNDVLHAWLRGNYEVDRKEAELMKVVNSILRRDTSHGKNGLHDRSQLLLE